MFSNLVEINLSDNPELVGTLPKLSHSLRYIDVSNTGLSGPIDLSSSKLNTCKFGTESKLCLQSSSLAGNLCSGVKNLGPCGLKATTSTKSTAGSTTTVIETESILSTAISGALASSTDSDIQLDNSDISTQIIIAWIVAAILMALSLIFCLCLMFAHKYGKVDKVTASRDSKTRSVGGQGPRLNLPLAQKEAISSRFESLAKNRSIYEARAEILADRIVSRNGERYFPVVSDYNKIKPDEMSLYSGDTVTLYKVFDDGWAEGISLRNGGSAYFPLKCLGGSVPSIIHDPDFFPSNSSLGSDLESINSPLPPLLHATPVFLSPTSASQHTILPLFDKKNSGRELSVKSENLIDFYSPDVKEESYGSPFIIDRNLDFDSSYNPFRGSLLNREGSTDLPFPDMMHSA